MYDSKTFAPDIRKTKNPGEMKVAQYPYPFLILFKGHKPDDR
jgi:hypothetical protein